MLEKLTHLDFEPHLETDFVLFLPGSDAYQARLIKVETIGREPEGKKRYPFSLTFHVASEGDAPPLPQRIYSFEHRQMGKLELFIVPVGRDAQGYIYEAVFT